MSYPGEDRHERDVGGSVRNPAQDLEKHDKSKGLSSNPGGISLSFYSYGRNSLLLYLNSAF